MFLKLNRLEDGSPIVVNMDLVSVIIANTLGRACLNWRDPDLEGLWVKQTLDQILERMDECP